MSAEANEKTFSIFFMLEQKLIFSCHVTEICQKSSTFYFQLKFYAEKIRNSFFNMMNILYP